MEVHHAWYQTAIAQNQICALAIRMIIQYNNVLVGILCH